MLPQLEFCEAMPKLGREMEWAIPTHRAWLLPEARVAPTAYINNPNKAITKTRPFSASANVATHHRYQPPLERLNTNPVRTQTANEEANEGEHPQGSTTRPTATVLAITIDSVTRKPLTDIMLFSLLHGIYANGRHTALALHIIIAMKRT